LLRLAWIVGWIYVLDLEWTGTVNLNDGLAFCQTVMWHVSRHYAQKLPVVISFAAASSNFVPVPRNTVPEITVIFSAVGWVCGATLYPSVHILFWVR
jgi:hypothetical protein